MQMTISTTQTIFTDTAFFYGTSIPLTYLMTKNGVTIWALLPAALFLLFHGYSKPKVSTPLDGFNLAKVISAITAVALVNAIQLNVVPYSFLSVAAVLAINIMEAVVTDLIIEGRYGWANAACGLILVLLLPTESSLAIDKSSGYFSVPLSNEWILLYTLWNSAFAYGVGFAWSFRLILISPLVVSYGLLGDSRTWLGARTYSLVLNQALRGARAMYIFTPGMSYITKRENEPSVNNILRLAWGLLNLAVSILTVYHVTVGKHSIST